MKWETTTILLDQLQDSQSDAWQRFADRFREPMLRFAGRFGLSDAQAEDAVQDTMVQFLEGYQQGRYDRTKGRLGSWLFALMYQSIRSHRRDGARSPKQSPVHSNRTTFFSALPSDDEARSQWELEWDRHAINRCLSQLRGEINPTHYRIFELMTLRQVPVAEVSEQVGLTCDAVYQARYRVLKRLEELRSEFDGANEVAS